MEEKITLDFFENSIDESIKKIAKYFHLDEYTVKEYINGFEDPADITMQKFVVDFDINLGVFDSANAKIICRHMTAITKEGLEDIITKGLLDLVGVLTEDTVLNRFLKENQVEFDVKNKHLIIDGQEYMITSTDEQCLFCMENRDIRCGRFERCDIREKMDYIGHKLYELGGTLEFFVSGTKEDMERYSVIHMNPEILETLDHLLGKIKVKTNRKEPFALSYKWRGMDKETYILQFPVSMADVEVCYLVDYERAYYNYEDILECSGYTHSDYLMHMVPENVYQNLKIIEWFLAACLCGSYQCGSLLPGKTVVPSLIKIVKQYA